MGTVTTPIAQKAAALASTKPAADALKAAREADIREDAAIDAEYDLSISDTAGKIKSDAGLGVSPEVEAKVAEEVTKKAVAKPKKPETAASKSAKLKQGGMSGQPPRVGQTVGPERPGDKAKVAVAKADRKAKAAAAPKGARVSKLGHARTEAWTDKAGSELVVGSVIVEPVKGTVKSRCTRPEKDGSRTPMVGVETDKPFTKNGRTVKVPTFVAAECLLKKK